SLAADPPRDRVHGGRGRGGKAGEGGIGRAGLQDIAGRRSNRAFRGGQIHRHGDFGGRVTEAAESLRETRYPDARHRVPHSAVKARLKSLSMKIQVNARNRAYTFEANEKEQILFSGLRNGINLPYECSTGTCGTCKAKLIDGKIYDPWPEAPGHKFLKRDQVEVLMCQCMVRTDVTVEVGNFVYSMDPGACLPESFFGVILRAKKLTHDVVLLEVEAD